MHTLDENRFLFHKHLMLSPLHEFLDFVLDLESTPREIYEHLIIPELYSIDNLPKDGPAIWTEHKISNRIRCLMENLSRRLYEEAYAQHDFDEAPLVVVLRPEGEYHDLAARMMVDVFVMAGFRTDFIGANTPKREVLSALAQVPFDYLALSVTEYYNLIATKHTIEELRKLRPSLPIIAGGQAFEKNPEFLEEMAIDHYIEGIEGVFRFAKELGL